MVYCISDIHGEYRLFRELLDKIRFSDSDKIIICGDAVDKGEQSIKLARFIFGMPNAVYLAGNHEYDFLKFYRAEMRSSPSDFDYVLNKLQNYFQGDGHLLDWETVDNFENLSFYLEEQDYICVHAGVPLDVHSRILPVEKASCEQLVYDRVFKNPDVIPKEGKCVLFGHTPSSYISDENKIIRYMRKDTAKGGKRISDYCKIHLDTGTYLSGVLGCFCIDNCEEYYVKKALH